MGRSRRDVLKLAVAIPAAILVGCGDKEPPPKPSGKCVLCCKCGQIKGSDLCCKTGAEKCTKCG